MSRNNTYEADVLTTLQMPLFVLHYLANLLDSSTIHWLFVRTYIYIYIYNPTYPTEEKCNITYLNTFTVLLRAILNHKEH